MKTNTTTIKAVCQRSSKRVMLSSWQHAGMWGKWAEIG
jgi:hypothetical protein